MSALRFNTVLRRMRCNLLHGNSVFIVSVLQDVLHYQQGFELLALELPRLTVLPFPFFCHLPQPLFESAFSISVPHPSHRGKIIIIDSCCFLCYIMRKVSKYHFSGGNYDSL